MEPWWWPPIPGRSEPVIEDFNIVFQLVDDGALVVAADPWTL
jgi:hypothetical protein